jgi:hypothetical protein
MKRKTHDEEPLSLVREGVVVTKRSRFGARDRNPVSLGQMEGGKCRGTEASQEWKVTARRSYLRNYRLMSVGY